MGERTKHELLRRAANLIGEAELAIALKIPLPLLGAWMNGHASIPDRKLIALIDILDEVTDGKK